MYRMIIVDDKPSDIRGIKKILDWNALGIEIVGECLNGKIAIEKIKELKPDIVLTDILMPLINGIKLAEKIREMFPSIKIIFTSCYSEFDYAKAGLDMGISGYVLKPIIGVELQKVMEKVIDDLRSKELHQKEKKEMLEQLDRSLPLVQEQFLKEMLLGNTKNYHNLSKWLDFLKLSEIQDGNIVVLFIEIDEKSDSELKEDVCDKFFVSYFLKNKIHEVSVNGMARLLPVQITQTQYAVIVVTSSEETARQNMTDLIIQIHTQLSNELGVNLTIGISNITNKISDISHLYNQAEYAVASKFYGRKNPLVFYQDIADARKSNLDRNIDLEELYRDVKEIVYSPEQQGVEEFIEKHFGMEDEKLPENYIKILTITVVNIVMLVLMERGQTFQDVLGDEGVIWQKFSRFETILDIKQWIRNIFLAVHETTERRCVKWKKKVVEDIINIIHRRYSEQLKISDIAKEVFLSTGYCNLLFKKETGMTIFDFLMEYRIEIAKKMLRDGNQKVAYVAEKVGYQNKSYFCFLFKRSTGMTPAEYKNRYA